MMYTSKYMFDVACRTCMCMCTYLSQSAAVGRAYRHTGYHGVCIPIREYGVALSRLFHLPIQVPYMVSAVQ